MIPRGEREITRTKVPVVPRRWEECSAVVRPMPPDAQFLHPGTQRAWRHFQQPGRAAVALDDPIRAVERSKDMVALDIPQGPGRFLSRCAGQHVPHTQFPGPLLLCRLLPVEDAFPRLQIRDQAQQAPLGQDKSDRDQPHRGQ